ncbi:Ig-like domain-containing protein [Staphylococcus agnetis]|uniref:Ig-like domain-containing protein n=1 Tax=Staphylococcus agnetis TaxID=985762 RepID=A0ABD7TYL6_9STAP|nr:Ig-like domain-containing protein [Staphylococcus agnetis]UXU58100.1 Ig-like domain-containing protein [Staphylococcus agnetis]UXU65068.1 Ig-like domain-containing protein [Staphylococcus agnetis]UXU67409.1 Ig-like domain-containing protein [Staphylococcus agnetis]
MINKQRYGIRKYKIGAASIALGTIVVIGVNENNEAHASEIQMQHSSNESSVSNVQNNAEPQQNNAPVETLKETHVDTNQQIIDEQKQQPIQHNEESVQSEEISVSKESIVQNNETNTSKPEVENKEPIVGPKTTTSSNVQPKATHAPRTTSSIQPRSTKPLQRTALKETQITGKDVSSKVEVTRDSITTKDKSNKVNPHQAGKVTVEYELIIGDEIQNGDYFDIKFSDNVDTNGIGTKKVMPDMKEGDKVIAKGIIMENGAIRYTFTDYVLGSEYIKAKLSINLFFKPSRALNNGTQKVSSTIGGTKTESDFEVEYLKGISDDKMSINGRIDKLDKENSKITHFTSVNANRNDLKYVIITGKLSEGQTGKTNTPKITIYEYNGSGTLSNSIYIDEKDKDFKDVTDSVSKTNTVDLNEDGSFTIIIDTLNSKPIFIKYEAEYDINNEKLNFQTKMAVDYNLFINYNKDIKWLAWDNEVEFFKNSASGAGKFIPIIDGGTVVDITTDSPIIVKGESDKREVEISGETNPIDYNYDSDRKIYINNNLVETDEVSTETVSGESTSLKYEETEDTIQIDSTDDTQDEVYNNNHIVETDDLSDITGGEINQNNNVVVIEDVTDPTGGKIDYNSDHVELDENSNPGGGRIDYNSDHIDLEENSNPGGGKIDYNSISVDLEEDSNPGGGKVDYNTNIIDIDEDSNFGEEDIYHNTDIIDFDEDTATGVVTGAISDHTTIEDTMEYTKDNNLIELVDDNTLPPAITGEAEGPIIEIDENHKVEIIDITMPIGEEGNVNGTVEETVENNVIDFDTESGSDTIHGNITGIVEEIDDNHVIDIEHGLDSENGSIDINDTVEDTMIDKPSIDNRTENPVIIVENTIPKNNGSVKGIIEELDITKVVSPVIVQKDKKNMPQATKNENVGVEKKARIGNVASQKNKILIIRDERKIKYNTNSQGCDSGHACVVNVKPHFEPISTVPHTSNDLETQLETLPNTGQNNNEQAVVFGGLLSLLGLSLLRRKGKKTIE